MKKSLIAGILVFLISGMLLSSNIFAQSKADKYLGKRPHCLEIIRINETKVLDDQTILFKTDRDEIYINRLPGACFTLKAADAFSYSTSLSRLCSLDMIRVLETDAGTAGSCGLGEFVELKGVKSIRDAVKLLKDKGLLESLVKENAFEIAFPE